MFKLSFKPYTRQMTKVLHMSRGEIRTRDGIIVRLEKGGKVSYGEAVTLPYFGTETVKESIAMLEALPKEIPEGFYKNIESSFPATRFALEAAEVLFQNKIIPYKQNVCFPISKLLTSKETAPEEVKQGLKQGYTTFKWKIGIKVISDEIETLHTILQELPKDCALRLDANGGLSKEQAQTWLKECESTQVEFIEQPLHPEKIAETISLQEKTCTPISLDESMASTEEMIQCFELGWRGIYVVKVSRLRELARFIEWRESKKIDVVYSSALETSIGTELSIQVAANDSNNKRALGYGVSHWFHEDGLFLHEDGFNLCSIQEQEKKFSKLWSEIN